MVAVADTLSIHLEYAFFAHLKPETFFIRHVCCWLSSARIPVKESNRGASRCGHHSHVSYSNQTPESTSLQGLERVGIGYTNILEQAGYGILNRRCGGPSRWRPTQPQNNWIWVRKLDVSGVSAPADIEATKLGVSGVSADLANTEAHDDGTNKESQQAQRSQLRRPSFSHRLWPLPAAANGDSSFTPRPSGTHTGRPTGTPPS
jgi:hypothetical protein